MRAAIVARLREPSSKAALAVLLGLVLPAELAGPVVDGVIAALCVWAIATPEGGRSV